MATATDTGKTVKFNLLDPETGERREVSNSADIEGLKAQREAQEAALRKMIEEEVEARVKGSKEASKKEAPQTETDNYDDLDAAEVKALAEERGIDLDSVKEQNDGRLTKKTLIAALRDQDEARRGVETVTGQETAQLGQE